MFTTVVVGVDGRQGGRDALALADQLGAVEITAVEAYPYEYFISRGANADFEAAVREDVQKELDAELTSSGVRATPVIVGDSSPARALHRVAERQGADLIVVGSAHRGRAGRVLLGDVSVGTLHDSPCPVLVAPTGFASHPRRPVNIGVAYDGRDESRAALDLADRLARATDGDLRVLSVLEPAWPLTSYPPSYHDWSEDAERAREAARQALEQLVTELRSRATGELLEGDPARELAMASRDLDLIVCGSRSFGPARRLLLGSTSARLLHEASCPVLVLPRGAGAASEGAATEAAAARAS